jgi:hypothetical protein
MHFNLSAHWRVTTPVVNRTSACLGEGSSNIPKRSTSYLGVKRATTSMSQALHAPELKWRTHGDFSLAHFKRLAPPVNGRLPLEAASQK